MFISFSGSKNGRSDDYIVEWRKLVLNNPYFTINHWLNEINAENAQAVIYTKESDEIMKSSALNPARADLRLHSSGCRKRCNRLVPTSY